MSGWAASSPSIMLRAFADRALAHVNAREVEAQPRIVGIVQQRVFEQAARAAEIAARFGGARLRGLRFAAQAVDAACLGLLFGVELIGELQRFVAAPLRGERADEAANRIGVVGLAPQCHPVRLFRTGRIAVVQQHFAEQHLRRDVGRIHRNRAFEQRLGLCDVAIAARADRVAGIGPVGRASQRVFPARRIAAARRAFQVVRASAKRSCLSAAIPMPPSASASFGLLASTDENFARAVHEVATIERGEALGDRCGRAHRRRRLACARSRAALVLLHHRIVARLDGGIVGRQLADRL